VNVATLCKDLARSLLAALLLAGTSGCITGPLIVEEVDRGVYSGRMPTSSRDYEALKARGVRTILSLQAMPWDVWPVSRDAPQAGFTFVNVPLLAVPWHSPSERDIRRVLTMMADPARRPIFVHCRLGNDRAAMLAGLYRIYYLGASPQEVWTRLVADGFEEWGLHGYKTYFWSHTEPPAWARPQPTAARHRPPP
jgi:hypothetical protein